MAERSGSHRAATNVCVMCRRVSSQWRKVFRLNQEPDGPGLSWGSFDKALALQGLDHVVNCRRRNAKIAFEIRLGGGAVVDLVVVVNVSEILTLLRGECGCDGRIKLRHGIDADGEGIFADTFQNPHIEEVDVSGEDSAEGFLGGGAKGRAQLFGLGAGTWEVGDLDGGLALSHEDPFSPVSVFDFKGVSVE